MKLSLLSIIATLSCLNACVSTKDDSSVPKASTTDASVYVALEHPLSLSPAITSSMNSIVSSGTLGFDSDLLGMANSVTKISTTNISASGGLSAGIISTKGESTAYRTTMDTVLYSSYPLVLKLLDRSGSPIEVSVVPLIGSGVRIIADYFSSSGSLGLNVLNANASSTNGSIQFQLLGINRLGASGGGIMQLNMTPESISIMKEQIASIMAQMWLKDTLIQPKVVGYTILSSPQLVDLSSSKIIPALLKELPTLSDFFFETQLMELYQKGVITPDQIPKARKEYKKNKLDSEEIDEKFVIDKMIDFLLKDRVWNEKDRTHESVRDAVISSMPEKFNCLGNDDWNVIQENIHKAIKGDSLTKLSC